MNKIKFYNKFHMPATRAQSSAVRNPDSIYANRFPWIGQDDEIQHGKIYLEWRRIALAPNFS